MREKYPRARARVSVAVSVDKSARGDLENGELIGRSLAARRKRRRRGGRRRRRKQRRR